MAAYINQHDRKEWDWIDIDQLMFGLCYICFLICMDVGLM